jgi:hypothetical protein
MLGLVAGLFLVPRTSTPVQAVSTFVDPCAGLPSPRTFIEGQGWWRDAGEDFFMQEHMHVAACVPVGQTVSGVLPVDVTVKLHNNDVGIWRVAADTRSAYTQFDFGCLGALACANFTPNLTCAAHDCTFTAHLDIPTQWLKYDGKQLIRIYAEAKRADGHETRAGFEFPLTLANGRLVSNFGDGMLSGVGWHANTGYSLAMSADLGSVPAAVKGIWRPYVFTWAAGTPITEYEVLIDSNMHALDRGIVVTEGAGWLFRNLSIDTTKLANGTHRLFFRAGSTVAKGTNSGILAIPFTVQN